MKQQGLLPKCHIGVLGEVPIPEIPGACHAVRGDVGQPRGTVLAIRSGFGARDRKILTAVRLQGTSETSLGSEMKRGVSKHE